MVQNKPYKNCLTYINVLKIRQVIVGILTDV